MIELATKGDIPRMVQLGYQLVQESPSYKQHGYNAVKVSHTLAHMIDNPDCVVYVTRHNGEIIGGIAGNVDARWFNDELIGYEYAFFVEPGKRNGVIAKNLINKFTAWCGLKGASIIIMGLTTEVNPEGTDRLYQHCGFENYGHLYKMEL